jgi:hypothetical protein
MYLAVVGMGWAVNRRADTAVFEATKYAYGDGRHDCTVYYFVSDTDEEFADPTVDSMGRMSWPKGVTCTVDQRGWVERDSFIDTDSAHNEGIIYRTSLEQILDREVVR